MQSMMALAVDEPARAAWGALGADARAHLAGFLGGSVGSGVDVTAEGATLPPLFAKDIACGGGRIRAAFPTLARRVMAIDGLAIRVACDGVQSGTFFGMVLPTARRVRFTELHELRVRGGVVVADRVTIDLGALVRQLVQAVAV